LEEIHNDLGNFWDKDANNYVNDRWTGTDQARRDSLETSKFLDTWVKPGGDLLDVGCGPGYWINSPACLWQRSVIGFDSSARRLNLSNYTTKVLGDANNLPFPGESFDTLIMIHVLEYLDLSNSLRSAYRVLRPGGRLVIVTKNRFGLPWRIALYLSEKIAKCPHPSNAPNLRQVRKYWPGKVLEKRYFEPRVIVNLRDVNDAVHLKLSDNLGFRIETLFAKLPFRRFLSWRVGLVLEKNN